MNGNVNIIINQINTYIYICVYCISNINVIDIIYININVIVY